MIDSDFGFYHILLIYKDFVRESFPHNLPQINIEFSLTILVQTQILLGV